MTRDGLVCTAKVKTSSTVATRAKKQRKGELVITSSTLLTRPVMKLFTGDGWQSLNFTGPLKGFQSF